MTLGGFNMISFVPSFSCDFLNVSYGFLTAPLWFYCGLSFYSYGFPIVHSGRKVVLVLMFPMVPMVPMDPVCVLWCFPAKEYEARH